MNKQKLVAIVSCMLLYSVFMPVADAEEASGDTEINVEVTAEKLKELNPAKITVIGEAQIKAQGARNVAEALKDVPGVYVSNNDAFGKSVAMFRGSDANNTRVFVDGVPLSPVVDGKVDLSVIPADSIAKIEVIKGTASVMYGINAPGGVILITTKKGGSGSSQLSVSTGSHRDESLSFSTSGSAGKLSYLFDVKKEHNDGYTVHSKVQEDNFNLKLNYDINPKASLAVMGMYTEKYSQIPNRIDPATGAIYTNSSLGSVTEQDAFNNSRDWEYYPWKSKYAAVAYNYKFSDDHNLSLKWYCTNEDAHLKALGSWGSSTTTDWRHQYTHGWVRGLELQDTLKTSSVNTFIWGATHESRTYNELEDAYHVLNDEDQNNVQHFFAGTSRSDYDYSSKSFYLEDKLKVSRKLAVNFGLRHEDINDWAQIDAFSAAAMDHGHILGNEYTGKGSPTKPEASFSYAMTDRTTLHGAVGKSYRWPNPTERLRPGGVYGEFGTSQWLNYNPITGQSYGNFTDKNVDGTTTTTPIQALWWHWPNGQWFLDRIMVNSQGDWQQASTTTTYLLPEEAINREIGLSHTFPFGLKLDATYFSKNISNMIAGQAVAGDYAGSLVYYNIPSVIMRGFEVEGDYPIGKRVKGFLSYSFTNALDPVSNRQVVDIPSRKFSYGFVYTGNDGMNAYLSLNYSGSYYSELTTLSGNGTNSDITPWVVPAHHTVDLKVSKTKDNREYYVRVTNLFDKKYYAGFYLLAPGRYVEIGGSVKF